MLLVTGASGMAGWHVVREALSRNLIVHGVYKTQVPANIGAPMHHCDLLDHDRLSQLIGKLHPSWVIHCAAMTNVDACEDDARQAMAVNARASGLLAAAAKQCGARFLYFSTDAVFDGSRGAWREDDSPAPVNRYGHSKLHGERLVLAGHPRALILRTNFFGAHPRDVRGLASWILTRLERGESLPGFTDVVFSPLWIGHLAQLVMRLPEATSGVMNLCGPERVSKYAFARQLARAAGFDPGLVRPSLLADADMHAPRPANSSLRVDRAETLLGRLPDLEKGLRDFLHHRQMSDTHRPSARGVDTCSTERTS